MMLAQGGVNLPIGYTKIEYLEGDGNHYFDTGFKPNQNSRIKLDIQVTKSATSFLFGARANSSANSASNSFSMPQLSGSSLRMDYGSKETSIAISPLQRLDIDVNKNVVTINGNVTTVPSQTFQSQYSLYLLSVNTAGALFSTQTAARIYSCQIYDNGTLVRDFIPAMNASGEEGLYDLKNDVWYALKPVVTKKENKIRVICEYYDGRDIYGFKASYPPTSNISISYHGLSFEAFEEYTKMYNDVYIFPSGYEICDVVSVSWNDFLNQYIGRSIVDITSISPTEDDTYIYTF